MNRPELLAPAGSMDSLRAAVNNGADAVYLGVGSFNARVNAQNFDMDDLPEAVSYAHLHGVLVYLTLNTLIHDDEIHDALDTAVKAYGFGVDALIVQDLGLTSLLGSKHPYIPLHASTQMNLFSTDSIQWAKKHHISRIILPRELSVEEIKSRISEANKEGIEVEVFIHGALCVSYSGLCLFSAMNGNGVRSGNRGLCAQPCRTQYKLMSSSGGESQTSRLLSPKDQCGAAYLPELMKAGVSSIKIEGRMKEPAYVAATVRAYREYIDEVFRGLDPKIAETQIMSHLLLAFNRGGSFTAQYLQGEKKGELLSGEYSGRYGVQLGVVVKKNARLGTLSLRHTSDILPVRGDYLSIRVKDVEIASFPIGSLDKMGDVLVVKGLHPQMIEKVPDGAYVFQMSEQSYTKSLLSGKAEYKTPIRMKLQYSQNSHLSVDLILEVSGGIWENLKTIYSIQIPQNPSQSELAMSRISEQLSKSKSSPFDVVSLEMDPVMSLRVPVSFVNELRREGFAELERMILEKKHSSDTPIWNDLDDAFHSISEANRDVSTDAGFPSKKRDILHVNYYDLHRILPQPLSLGADYYSFSVYDLQLDAGKNALNTLHHEEPNAKILIWLPGAYKDSVSDMILKVEQYMEQIFYDSYAGIVSSHLRCGKNSIWLNASANLYNSAAISEALSAKPFAFAPSYELKDREVHEILISPGYPIHMGDSYISLHRYGRIEWMQSEFCPVGKHAVGCRKCNDNKLCFSLRMQNADDDSKKGKTLPVITHPGPCSSEILGQLHVSVGDELLQTCKDKQIPVAHTVRFLDEFWDERKQIVLDIQAKMNEM